jgi:DNA-binding MarR family transcriptional regulator
LEVFRAPEADNYRRPRCLCGARPDDARGANRRCHWTLRRKPSEIALSNEPIASRWPIHGGVFALSRIMTNELYGPDYAALAVFHDQLHRVMGATERSVRQAGLDSTAFMALLAIKNQTQKGGATIGTLAQALQTDRNAAGDVLEELIRRGFVTRTRDASDRRRFLLALTPSGEAWLRPLAGNALQELTTVGPELLRNLRVVVAHAVARANRPAPAPHTDIEAFAWRVNTPLPV